MRISPAAPLVLGSASPRRRDLLASAGIPFTVRPADVDEASRSGEEPASYLTRVVADKLEAVRSAGLPADGAVLVADTIVVAPTGRILGKPRDEEAAAGMIRSLSGATHCVVTCFALGGAAPGAPPKHRELVTTLVTFRALVDGEVEAYATSGEGLDKAGAYAIQGRAAAFVERVEGSYTNVVGLPLAQVVVALRKLGWTAEQ